jgi:hypothetical protein
MSHSKLIPASQHHRSGSVGMDRQATIGVGRDHEFALAQAQASYPRASAGRHACGRTAASLNSLVNCRRDKSTTQTSIQWGFYSHSLNVES